MVAYHNQFERWLELEEIPIEQPRADRVASGDRLDPAFGPGAPLFGFGHGDKALAAQPGQIGGVRTVAADREAIERRGRGPRRAAADRVRARGRGTRPRPRW